MKVFPAKKLSGKVARTLNADGEGFVSRDVKALELTYEGVVGDRHAGLTRPSNAREPWYPRGTEMRNEQQVSILSVEELADIAAAMGIETLDAGWIGANLLVEGIKSAHC